MLKGDMPVGELESQGTPSAQLNSFTALSVFMDHKTTVPSFDPVAKNVPACTKKEGRCHFFHLVFLPGQKTPLLTA